MSCHDSGVIAPASLALSISAALMGAHRRAEMPQRSRIGSVPLRQRNFRYVLEWLVDLTRAEVDASRFGAADPPGGDLIQSCLQVLTVARRGV